MIRGRLLVVLSVVMHGITYDRGGKPVLHDCAFVHGLSLPHVYSPMPPAHSEASSSEQWAAINRRPKRSL